MEFQKKEITLVKDTKNPFYNSMYATLNQVLDKVRKPLMDMNVLIFQAPEKDGLRTTLLDMDDDTKVECLFPFADMTSAQKVGANITYGRRYSLVALLGLEDEDDDGNSASQPTQKPLGATQTPRTPKYEFAPKKATTGANGDIPFCVHGVGKRVMSKTAKNMNRWFYSCSAPKGEQCQNSFLGWEDELAPKNDKATLDEEIIMQGEDEQ